MSGITGNKHLRPVAVIIPVYRNLEVTRNCLESLLKSDLPEHAVVTIIDDNSPEKEVSAYCQEVTERSSINLIVNKENLGFVGTANKGFFLDTDADVILLNSDTVVHGDWVQRLQACAYREGNIGTVTPFSNNGTICSYPVFSISNSIPEQWNAREIDHAFQSGNPGLHCEIPTAVGFCMYIKRSCLNATGIFNEEAFGHGYGEECDFSLRASDRGWKHVIAADVFVYHEGAASFASESTDRKMLADTIMNDLHPGYNQLVIDFIAQDPLYFFRRNVDSVRLRDKPNDATSILEEHFQYSKIILERAEQERRNARDEQEERQKLEAMLACARQEFAQTDYALNDAQALVSRLRSELERSQTHIEKLDDEKRTIEQEKRTIEQEKRTIEQEKVTMEQKLWIMGKKLSSAEQSLIDWARKLRTVEIEKRSITQEKWSMKQSVQDEQEQRLKLEAMLNDARHEFAETDSALAHAQALVNRLNLDLEQSREQREQLNVELNSMHQRLKAIQQSRLWRYTNWLRGNDE